VTAVTLPLFELLEETPVTGIAYSKALRTVVEVCSVTDDSAVCFCSEPIASTHAVTDTSRMILALTR
jgi:hypothetical protein